MTKSVLLEYFTPIQVEEATTQTIGLPVRGVALRETISKNGVRYTAAEMEMAAETFKDRPLMKNHSDRVEDIVGRVTNAYYNSKDKTIEFQGNVLDKQMQEMVKDGRVREVSIRASCKDLVEETVNGETARTAHGMQGEEISFVAVPGVNGAQLANASFEMAITEAFKKVKEKNMTEEKVKEAEMPPAPVAPAADSVLQKLDNIEKMLTQLLAGEQKELETEAMPSEKAPEAKAAEAVDSAKLAQENKELKEKLEKVTAVEEAPAKTVDKVEESDSKDGVIEKQGKGYRVVSFVQDYSKYRKI